MRYRLICDTKQGARVLSRDFNSTEVRAVATVRADGRDPDRWATCAPGIHFFITRLEAENYEL